MTQALSSFVRFAVLAFTVAACGGSSEGDPTIGSVAAANEGTASSAGLSDETVARGAEAHSDALSRAGLQSSTYTRIDLDTLDGMIARARAAGENDLRFSAIVLADDRAVDEFLAAHPDMASIDRGALRGRELVVVSGAPTFAAQPGMHATAMSSSSTYGGNPSPPAQ